MSRKPATLDNGRVKEFLDGYLKPWELCQDFPRMDDIITGVLEAKTSGNSSTRGLSRNVLFHVLQVCDPISVESVRQATGGRYGYSTIAAYASAARVASRAIAGLLDGWRLAEVERRHRGKARKELDAPWLNALAEPAGAIF